MQSGFRQALFKRILWRDVGLILLVPAILVVGYRLPPSIKGQLVLQYWNPTLLTAYTAHFVHLNGLHLLSNLLMYLVVVPLIYSQSVLTDRRTEFYIVFVSFLLVFPLILSGLNLVFPRPRIGYGFSGVVMAFIGYLTVIQWDYLAKFVFRGIHRNQSPIMFFFVTMIIAAARLPSSIGGNTVVGLSIAGGLLYLPSIAARNRKVPHHDWDSIDNSGFLEIGFWGIVLVIAMPFFAFPVSPTGNGTILNIYSHFLGFGLGFLVPFIFLQLVAPRPSRDHGDPPGSIF